MKLLTLVRHSIAVDSDEAYDDFSRTLTTEGKNLAIKVVQFINTELLNDAFFISSPAPRALETAVIFAQHASIDTKQIVQHKFLYNWFSIQSFVYFLDEVARGRQNVWIFGHNPMLSQLVHRLNPNFKISLPKCSVVIFKTSAKEWIDLDVENTTMINFINSKQI